MCFLRMLQCERMRSKVWLAARVSLRQARMPRPDRARCSCHLRATLAAARVLFVHAVVRCHMKKAYGVGSTKTINLTQHARDRPGGLTSPALHACGCASPSVGTYRLIGCNANGPALGQRQTMSTRKYKLLECVRDSNQPTQQKCSSTRARTVRSRVKMMRSSFNERTCRLSKSRVEQNSVSTPTTRSQRHKRPANHITSQCARK